MMFVPNICVFATFTTTDVALASPSQSCRVPATKVTKRVQEQKQRMALEKEWNRTLALLTFASSRQNTALGRAL